jgi:hypothetical protein
MSNPLTALPAAEAAIVQAINAASSTLDGIATGSVDAALARLESSAAGVRERIARAMSSLKNTVAGLVESIEREATSILEDLSTDAHREVVAVTVYRASDIPDEDDEPVTPSAAQVTAPAVPTKEPATEPSAKEIAPQQASDGHWEGDRWVSPLGVVSPAAPETVATAANPPLGPNHVPDIPKRPVRRAGKGRLS